MKKTLLTATLLLAAAALPVAAQQPQLKTPRPSQRQSVTQTVGITDITVVYSRPGVKGRQIWGTLVPFDKVWRTGANEATTIAFSDEVSIGGQKIPAGTYSLHTIPGKDEWTIILNSVANQWGSYSYDEKKDVLRFKAKPEKAEFREWFSIEFPQIAMDSATIALRWENVSVPFTVRTDTVAKTLAGIRSALATAKADDWRTPYVGAQFAFENNVAGDDATKWIDASVKADPNTSNLWLQARMQAKAGQKAEAKKTAAMAIEKAKPDQSALVNDIKTQIATW